MERKKIALLIIIALFFVLFVSCCDAANNADFPKLKITVGDTVLIATLEDNATTRALIEMLPLTLSMMDLYNREMCYRFDKALPSNKLRSDEYEVGDLIYWPPRNSFVILYAQNGERFSRQHLGKIDSGVEIFTKTGDVNVTIERD